MKYWRKTETDHTLTYKFKDGGVTIVQMKGVKEGGTNIERGGKPIIVPKTAWEELIEDIKTYDAD